MRRQIFGSLLVFVAASAMAADVASPAVSTSTEASASASAPATPNTTAPATPNTSMPATAITDTVPAKAENPKNAFRGYKLVKKNGVEKYCRRQPVLGSRTKTIETCLTLEEMAVLRETGQDMMDNLQRMPGGGVGTAGGGGVYNSAVTPMGQ